VLDQGQVDIVLPASGTPCGSIEVAVAAGVVTLNDRVPSLSHKRLAGVLAWSWKKTASSRRSRFASVHGIAS
jgi:hypothetical protein